MIGENSTDSNAHNGTAISVKSRSVSQWENLRRHVRNSSSKSLYNKSENSLGTLSNSSFGLKNKESSNGSKDLSNNIAASSDPFKGGSLLDYNEKNPPLKQVEPEVATFVKGSLLSNDAFFEQAKEREKVRKAIGGLGIIRDPSSPTFVNFDSNVKFNKGSLLSRNNDTITENNFNSNSSGHLVQIEDGVQFNKGSLLTKVQESSEKNNNSQRLKPLGLSKSATTQNISPIMLTNGKTLLELDLKPDAAHTLALRSTNFKPLLSFVPRERDNNVGVKSPRNLRGFKNDDEKSETDGEYDSDYSNYG